MKRVFNGKTRQSAFSMAEMLVVMLVLAIVIIAMTPMRVKRIIKNPVTPDHGSFECYYGKDPNTHEDKLIQRTRDANGELLGAPVYKDVGSSCTFTPKRGAMFFTINAVGGGSPGTGIKSVFEQLPEGLGGSGSSSSANKAGVNYKNDFTKFNSLYYDVFDKDTTVNFATVMGSDSGSNPRVWLRDNGFKVRAILASNGGTLTDATGAAYLSITSNTGVSGCSHAHPNFKDTTFTGSEWKSKCFTYHLYPGVNPAPGLRLLTNTFTVKDGNHIRAFSNGGAPQFSAGVDGCQVSMGGNGCYNHLWPCSPAQGKYSKYNSSNCRYADTTDGYPYQKYTANVVSSSALTPFEPVPTSGDCDVNQTSTTGECSPQYITKDSDVTDREPLFVFGQFGLIFKELSKGINFYAQAGQPGEYRTLYVSRFKKSVRITPGAPKDPSTSGSSNNSLPGNDTIICYPGKDNTCSTAGDNGAVQLLRAAGGKRAVSNTQETFILGNLFNLPEGVGQVIAYDTANGVQGDTYDSVENPDDLSANSYEYGNYFLPQSSGFIYPIANPQDAIPDSIGQGGHGAYTIYRRSGKSDRYEMRWANFSSSSNYQTQKTNTSGSDSINANKYVCRSNGKSLTGSDAAAHRCEAGRGEGGAVVISW